MIKNLLIDTLLTGTLIIAAALSAKAQTGPGLDPSDISESRRQGTYANVCTQENKGRLSLRTGPGTNFKKTKEISNGHRVALNASEYGKDGFRWWNVYHNGTQGWIRADYVCGDPQ